MYHSLLVSRWMNVVFYEKRKVEEASRQISFYRCPFRRDYRVYMAFFFGD
ncbi:MAG: hypothetical protein VX876_04630 [Planctomycetota bacterium]|nr:hypothetical protein [Planctomycetota bacterium]